MKLRWLLLSILGVLVFGSPADAGQLLSWDYEQNKNRLVFATDERIQPRVKVLANPTRLVIELPETTLGRTTVKEKYLGAIRGFRIGQSTDNTVNLVIELAPGYTIDPERVRLQNLSANEWTVDLPSPRITNVANARKPIPTRESVIAPPPKNSPLDDRNSKLERSSYLKTTSHGFFLDIEGDRSNQVSPPILKGDTVEFELEGVTLPSDLVTRSVAVKEYGVEEMTFTQPDPDVAKISLKLSSDSSNWRATFSRRGGLILVPSGKRTRIARTSQPTFQKKPIEKKTPELPNSNPIVTEQNNTATVRAIDLTDNDTKLSVRSDGNVRAYSRFVGNGKYEVTISNARLGEPFVGPQLRAGSPITQLKVREENSTVILTITTRLGVRLGNVQNATNLVALPIINPRSTTIATPTRPVPTNNKPLVIIDAGHGGQDPGTIGIGGVQEKNVVLPISLDVAEELRKQGIEVRMTRDRDYFVSLEGRTDMANEIDADLFVSIHANAINLSRPDVNGLETYYYKSGRRLAEVIHWNILNTVNIRDRKIRRARFFVLRHSKMPAVLVEVGFLTGAEDSSRLKNPDHRRQMAKAIARGIVQYIKEKKI